jgi:hypothetical protein
MSLRTKMEKFSKKYPNNRISLIFGDLLSEHDFGVDGRDIEIIEEEITIARCDNKLFDKDINQWNKFKIKK